jgi:outer membrane protein assembly factor BamB
MIWNNTKGGSVLAYASGRLYISGTSLDTDEPVLRCLDGSDGSLIWNRTIQDGLQAAAVGDDMMIALTIGRFVDSTITDAPRYVHRGILTGFDLFNGNINWSWVSSDGENEWETNYCFPALARGIAYVMSRSGKIYAFCTLTSSSDISVGDVAFPVSFTTNSIVHSLVFNGSSREVCFKTASYGNSTWGHCSVIFPTQLLGGPYTVLVDDSPANIVDGSNADNTTLSFSYGQGPHVIRVTGTTAVPESPSSLALVLGMVFLSAVLILLRGTRVSASEVRTSLDFT